MQQGDYNAKPGSVLAFNGDPRGFAQNFQELYYVRAYLMGPRHLSEPYQRVRIQHKSDYKREHRWVDFMTV